MFRVLIENLPEGSALHRSRYEGRTWTSLHAMVWAAVQHLGTLDAHTVQAAGGKAKTQPWREFPWTKSKDKQKRTLGQRGRMSDSQVKTWLDSMLSRNK